MKKGRIILTLVVLVLLAAGVCLLVVGMNPTQQAVREMLDTISMAPAGDLPQMDKALELLAELPPEEQQKALMWNILHGENDDVSLRQSQLSAVLAVRLHAAGVLPREAAAAVVTEALTIWPVWDAWNQAYQAELPGMLALCDDAQRAEIVKKAEVARSEDMQRILGDAVAQLPLTALMDVLAARFDAGLSGDTLVRRALALHTQEEVVATLAAEADEARRNALARGYGLTLSNVDDVLTYLADARAVGIPARVCYPEGAVVTWDLSRLGRNGWPSLQLAEGARYLVVHCREDAEAFEWRDVPLEMDIESETTYEGAFSTYYESNDGRWMETVTVTLDTAVMDATPAEFLPADLSEVDAMVVCDTRYVAWGNLRVQQYIRKGRETGSTAVTSYRDYRCYGVEQTVDVYNAVGRLVRRFGFLETAPDGMENRTDGFSDTRTEEDIRRGCHAQPDEAWMQARYDRVMTMLQENGGDLSKTILAK